MEGFAQNLRTRVLSASSQYKQQSQATKVDSQATLDVQKESKESDSFFKEVKRRDKKAN